MRSLVFVVGVGFLAIACGDDGPTNTNDAAPRPDAGAMDFRPDFAGQVRIMEGSSGTAQEFFAIRAWMTDKGLLPPGQFLASDGDCAVYIHPEPGSCTPDCGAQYCNANDQCEPFPEPRSAGTITVTGLAQALQFTPGNGGYDRPSLTGNLFDNGDAITVTAAGDDIAAFSANLTGVAPLEMTTTSVSFENPVDQQITWVAENSGRIQLALIVGWHLAPYEALVLCETDDDGSLTITGNLISQVPRQSSFLESHSSTVARFNRQIVETSVGAIEVIVGSQQSFYFNHFPQQ